MLNILLCGSLGKMGAAVKAAAEGSDVFVAAEVDARVAEGEQNAYQAFSQVEGKYDCIIDFSHPSVTDSMLDYALETKTPVVLCTTGLSEQQLERVRAAGEQIPVFFSANMSLGVNLIVALCKKATELLSDDFDIEIIEKHHNQKVDAPSGTAIMLADAINEAAGDKYEYVYERASVRKKREKKELGIHSLRGGNIVGEHEVIFAGHDECVSIKHSATSKEVFAVGAINAARFLVAQGAGIYSMADMLK
ncbi:MAG: 4-hydroxy-tetrahydrodipicolinate reductase [Oscillospiraceae bacterium]|nr:4-hydroxy-tetrahydrodipicolinate reductase [Oscillospiraceae bacterium]